MKLPLVSTIITTYNRPKLLLKAIKSAVDQTYPEHEIIVVNDGGKKISQSTKTIFPQVEFIDLPQNQGLSVARNTGLKKTKGSYVAFLDDDDQWLSNKLEDQVGLALKHRLNKYGVFYCAQKVTKANGRVYINHPKIRGKISTGIIKNGLSTISSTNLFTREALEKTGGFDENLKSNIDHDIWMALAFRNYWANFIDKPLVINLPNKHQRMVGDHQPRIISVEQYLKKWQPTINKWFGTKEGKRYSINYFNYVIGWLAEEQFKVGKIKQGLICLQKLITKHPFSVKNLIFTPLRCLGFLGLHFSYILLPISKSKRISFT